MNPEQQLDQDAVRLAKAIRNVESRDNINAKGKSGEFGLYQFMPDTWASTTKKYNLDSGDLSRENQNAAAYYQIKELKDKGYTPDKIAAFWNSGKTEGWENMRGVNKYGVKYDVPQYVSGVQQAYEQLKTSESGGKSVITPSTVGHQESVQKPFNPVEAIIDVNKGIVKGAGDAVLTAMRQGETVANQTAGRVVSALTGGGFKPLPQEEIAGGNLGRNPTLVNMVKPKNTAQKIGYYGEKTAEVIYPGGAGSTALLKARAAKRTFEDALEVVAPKETRKVLENAYKQGRTRVSGFLRNVDMTPDQQTERAAQAVEGIVKRNLTASENANAVHSAIGKEAETLVKQLQSQEIKILVQPEDLDGLIARATQRISESPTMVGNPAISAERIFNNFKKNLPKGRDITAEDILEARKKTDAFVRAEKGDKVFDPATENAMSIALRTIRQEANDLVASKAPDVAVKESLAKQSAMYDALDNIASKGVSEAGTNAVTRFMKRNPTLKQALLQLLPTGLIGGYLGSQLSD